MARANEPKQIHQLTVSQFERMFPDEDACKAYLIRKIFTQKKKVPPASAM
jgi:hypothetical protein